MKKLNLIMAMTLFVGACASLTPSGDDDLNGQNAVATGINGTYEGLDSYAPGRKVTSPFVSRQNVITNAKASNGDYYDNAQYGKQVVGGPRSPAKDRVIYFAYDSSDIDTRAVSIIRSHAAYLKQNPNLRVLLEGHTDSRGSRGYNISLGERRAIAVMRKFLAEGVSPHQIRVISYGEEQPAVDGMSASAYQRNRRAIIQY